MVYTYERHGEPIGMDRGAFDSAKRAFDIYDNDGSGQIDLQEFSLLMKALGMKMSEFHTCIHINFFPHSHTTEYDLHVT